ncbi:septation protein SepH [Antribacter gilvus]|uniref:septation protein SepH n=1 Tax=Antribacter gilvus TaxID=2304675 RepID=UPI0013DEA08D|nr:septation protein SepH [Antribacter gilvus]
MDELELVRLHEDGERLVLTAPDGTQSTLPITDALRAAIRGDRPRLESIRAQEESTLRPREIQARLRAGSTCEELAEASGLPVEHVRRFEYPVMAEREHAIRRVRTRAVAGEEGDSRSSTTLGELVDARLASRGVRPEDAIWTARRDGMAPWVVQVSFETAGKARVGRWTFDPRGMVVTTLDDEARWLALPDDGGQHLSSVSALPEGRSRTRPPAPESDDTDLLLDDLSERRGQRPSRRPGTAHPSDGPDELELGELTLAELAPRRGAGGGRPPSGGGGQPGDTGGGPSSGSGRSSGSGGSGGPGGHPGTDDDAADAPAPAASVVDLGSRRGAGRPSMPGVGPRQDGGAALGRSGHPAGTGHPGPPPDDGPGPDRGRGTGLSDESNGPVTPEAADLDWEGPSRWEIPEPEPARAAATAAAARAPAPSAEEPVKPKASPKTAQGRRPARKGRAQVPSWDEIVFGARPEG